MNESLEFLESFKEQIKHKIYVSGLVWWYKRLQNVRIFTVRISLEMEWDNISLLL